MLLASLHSRKQLTLELWIVFNHIEKRSRRFGIVFVKGSGKSNQRVITFGIRRNRDIERFRDFAEDLVALAANQQVGFLVFRSPLKIDNDELALLRPEDFVSFQNFETCADANDQISFC